MNLITSCHFLSVALLREPVNLPAQCRNNRPPVLTKQNFRKFVDNLYLASSPDVVRKCKSIVQLILGPDPSKSCPQTQAQVCTNSFRTPRHSQGGVRMDNLNSCFVTLASYSVLNRWSRGTIPVVEPEVTTKTVAIEMERENLQSGSREKTGQNPVTY